MNRAAACVLGTLLLTVSVVARSGFESARAAQGGAAAGTGPVPARAPSPATQRAAPEVQPAGNRPRTAPPLMGDQTDGSRARPVHAIPLRDTEGEVIRPTDRPLVPFSPRQTCGADCHDVATIATGWHFRTGAAPGARRRRGEPWILTDEQTATQIPLSSHGWPGTFSPGQVGLTPWRFATMFGGRTPGGLSGEGEPGPELRTRWVVSGDLEPNCLACHDGSPAYDHAEYGRQVRLENFRWAAAAASGLALVTGAAREMPSTYDYLLPSVEDALRPRMPTVAYVPERFLPGARMVFDIVREVPARRCYFCHSQVDLAHTGQGRWTTDEDIHLSRGMTCVDCHRNGLDHAMIRGDEVPAAAPGSGASLPAASFSCRGCHLAGEADRIFVRGRRGAPYPRHNGLPPVHLTKLSCTACHAGPRPEPVARGLKTSRAHRLGGLNVNKASGALPHLYAPILAEQDDGQTTPHRAMWPAFWGRLESGTVRPIPPDRVKAVMAKGRVVLAPAADGSWPSLPPEALSAILRLLASDATAAGTPVYVAGGRLHRLGAAGGLEAVDHPAARPYLWPIGHDVRPVALALGARGCEDCHDESAPIFAGRVPVDSPLASDRGGTWSMTRSQKSLDAAHFVSLARSFRYRPWLKGAASAVAVFLALVVLTYLTPGLRRLSAVIGGAAWVRGVVNLAGVVSCAVAVASAFPELLSGRSLTGVRLTTHVTVAAIFTGIAALVAVCWADRSRFDSGDWTRLCRPLGSARRIGAASYLVVLRKAAFWVVAAAMVPAIASVMLAMFPLLRSIDLQVLRLVHRYSVAVVAGSAALFVVSALATWASGLVARPGRGQPSAS